MDRKLAPLLLTYLLSLSYGIAATAAADQEGLELLSIVYPPHVEVGQPANITVTLTHEKASIPTLTLYYAYFLNHTVLAGGWRVSPARLEWTNGEGVSIYKAEIPNPAYAEAIPYNSKVIFYLEAKELLGESLLTCGNATRWNPYAQQDKYSFLIVDETPPNILEVSIVPETLTELDSATIIVRAMDKVSGVAEVQLSYLASGVEKVKAMNATLKGVYEAAIPPQPSGTRVTYSITALDGAGNEASAGPYFYTVTLSPSIRIQQAKRALTYMAFAAAAILVGAVAYLWRSGWRPTPKPECMHPKAMTSLMLLTLLVAAVIYYQFAQLGSSLIGLLIAAGAVISWSLFDPRIILVTPNKLRLDKNPPLTLIAEGSIIAFISTVVIAVSTSLRFGSLAEAYTLAVIAWKCVVGLMATGLILQALWPQLKDFKFFIEVEELKE